ncbi:hypothetical protein FJTKL_08690 [Diaporthe vaccinii]|uniref:Uncharacterized protein n=1 Tax=Diaporthe vaccinii TaxID=105482 RepID=A0ABR4ER01_9PEZI
MGGQLGSLYRQLAFHPKPVPDKIRVDGRTALVTGAGTIGSLGHEAAKEMAAHGLSPRPRRPLFAVRGTIVTSEVHFWTKFEEQKAPNILDRMDDPDSFKQNSMDRYNASKLLKLLWLRELNARTDGSVIINGVNPGLCASSLHRSHSGVAVFNKLFAWSSQEGGHALADATMQHTERGAYISEQVIKQPSPFDLSPDGYSTQKKLWRETLEILQSVVPGMNLKERLAGDK